MLYLIAILLLIVILDGKEGIVLIIKVEQV